MLRDQTIEPQTEQMDDCLRRLTLGHQHATAAWIWQIIGLTWDPERAWAAEHKRATHGRASECLTQWVQEAQRRPGAKEYLNMHSGSIMPTLVGQLRVGRSKLRQRAKTREGCNEDTELEHRRRRLQEWTKGIPITYRAAVDSLIADRMGIGVVEGLHWQQAGTEAGYTEAIQRLNGRRQIQPTVQSPNRCKLTETHRQHSFR